jgi:hypothetical protein
MVAIAASIAAVMTAIVISGIACPTGMSATNSDEAPQVVGTPQASEDLLLAEKDDPGW